MDGDLHIVDVLSDFKLVLHLFQLLRLVCVSATNFKKKHQSVAGPRMKALIYIYNNQFLLSVIRNPKH